jgi:2-desacetyl-2-hydroxyethyl bacteriochlorophyllide A dehydrogenase
MRAVVMNAPYSIEVTQRGDQTPGSGEVLVAVQATGICAGDMYIYLGKNPYVSYPQVGGHEIAGLVQAVGAGVTSVQPGDAVVVEPFLGCGKCYPCRVGKANCCANLQIIGVHRAGGFAEYVIAPASHIHHAPAGLSPRVASFAEPVAIGVQACRRGQVSADDYVLILGCGPIGLALIEVAKARGARVLATDVLADRLNFAAQLGAETLPADDHLRQQVWERTNGEGMPVVIEATGNPQVMEQTVELVAAGGRIVIVGLVKQGVQVSFPGLDFTRKEMTVVGSRASVHCFPEALHLLASGAIHYPQVATEFDMWDAPEIFATLTKQPNLVHKAVLMVKA